MQAEADIVDLVSDDDEGGNTHAQAAATAQAPSKGRRGGGGGGGGDKKPAAAPIVLDTGDEDEDEDEDVIVLPDSPVKKKGKRSAAAAASSSSAAAAAASAEIEVIDDGGVTTAWGPQHAHGHGGQEDSAWLEQLQLPPEACEKDGCGMTEHVVRLQGCGHGVCLFCLRGPYEELALEASSLDAVPTLRCPIPNCGRSLLAAADALHLLAPADFDVYAKERLKAFKARRTGSTAAPPCPSCGKKGRGTPGVVGKRKRDDSAGGGSGQGKAAAWERALEAAEVPSPLVLECPGGCNLLYCQLCETSLAPASSYQAWRAGHETEGRTGCACVPLQRLTALEAATVSMLEEMQRERKGKRSAKKQQGGGGAQKGKWAAGTGFGGSGSGYSSSSSSYWGKKKGRGAQPSKQEEAAKARQAEEDAGFVSVLTRWRDALPKQAQEPILPETHHLLARAFSKEHGAVSSPLLQLLRLLLRNDSVMDMTARREVYQMAFDVVLAVAAHPLVGPVLERPVDDEAEDEDEDEEGAAAAAKKGGATTSSSSSPSLLVLMEELHSQATFHAQCGGKAMGGEIASQDEDALFHDLTLSTKIIQTHDDVTRRLEQHRQQFFFELQAYHKVEGKLGHPEGYLEEKEKGKGKGKGKAGGARLSAKAKAAASEAEAEANYKRVLGGMRMELVPLEKLVEERNITHAFVGESKQATGSVPIGANNHIFREITTLRTSLPVEYGAGIWLRVDEDKNRMLKALIAGPMDTPYAHGLFEFDILLPQQYPNTPPKVLLKTTGGNTFRFNPNLYNCGKVCLSLLGTWPGPGWESGKSTLLQVLVSIQSLIMVQDAYFNEPSYERQINTPEGTRRSNEYNAVIRRGTLQYAVLEQMQRPSPVFEDVIKNHFALRRTQLLAQCDQWLREDGSFLTNAFRGYMGTHGAGGGGNINMPSTVGQIKALLQGQAWTPAPAAAAVGQQGGGGDKDKKECVCS